MKTLVLISFSVFLSLTSVAQSPSIQWQKTYGGSSTDIGSSICKSFDGGFMIAASSMSNDNDVSQNYGGPDFWIVKVDSVGSIKWEKSYGGTSVEEPIAICPTYDMGYIIFGYTGSEDYDVVGLHIDSNIPFPNYDGWLLKIDSIGQIQWQHCYGGTENDYGRDLTITSDTGYLFAEIIQSWNGDVSNYFGQNDYWLVKVDTSGVIEWEKTYGGPGDDDPNCCSISSDENCFIGGSSFYDFGGLHGTQSDLGIVKVNSFGNNVWTKSYGGPNLEYPYSIIPTSDGGLIVLSEIDAAGGDISHFYGASDFWVFKTDSNGSIIWEKTYGGNNYDKPAKIINSSDGGLILTGYTASSNLPGTIIHGVIDYWVIKLDSAGNFIWGKVLGGSDEEGANSIIETTDGGFIVCGYTLSNDGDVSGNHGDKDVWVVKLAPPNVGIPILENQLMDFSVSQNEDELQMRFFYKQSTTVQCIVLDLNGKNIFEKSIQINAGINYQLLPCESFSSGVYVIDIEGENISQRLKATILN